MNRAFVLTMLAVCAAEHSEAARPPMAQVTQAVRDVQWVGPSGSEKASEGQAINGASRLRSGRESRAEVKLRDGAIARVGADTAAKIDGKLIDLENGLLLVESPRHGSRLALRARGIGAAVTGTTTLIEYHEPIFKFLVLQGTARLYRPGLFGDSVLVQAGQMVFGKTSGALNDAVDFKLDRFLKTCRLLNDLGPLPNDRALVAVANEQNRKHRDAKLIETNLVIYGEGTAVTVTKEGNSAGTDSADTAGTPPPSIKSGASTITAPTQTAIDARRP